MADGGQEHQPAGGAETAEAETISNPATAATQVQTSQESFLEDLEEKFGWSGPGPRQHTKKNRKRNEDLENESKIVSQNGGVS